MQTAQQRVHAPNGNVSTVLLPLLPSLNKARCSLVSSKPYKPTTRTLWEKQLGTGSTAGRYTRLSCILILHIAKCNIIYNAYPIASPKVESPLISSPFYWLQCTVAHGNSHWQGWGLGSTAAWHAAEALTMSTINQVTVCNCLHLFLLSFGISAIVGQNSETAD